MAKRRNGPVQKRGGGGNGTNQSARRRGASQIPRPLARNRVHVQRWITLDGKPEIPANQTMYSFSRQINAFRFPELQDYMTRYQTFMVNSLGARFMSGMENIMGSIALMAVTEHRYSQMTIPPATNHMWLKSNGCKVSPCRSQCNSPPSSDLMKQVIVATPSAGNNNPGSSLGFFWWVFEGPSDTANRSHLGEIEVYVDVIFDGL